MVRGRARDARAQVTLYTKPGKTLLHLRYGQNMELDGKVRPPPIFGNPGAFDYAHYLARQNIYWTVSAAAGTLRIQPGQCGNRFQKAVMDLRQASLERIERLYHGDNYQTAMMQAGRGFGLVQKSSACAGRRVHPVGRAEEQRSAGNAAVVRAAQFSAERDVERPIEHAMCDAGELCPTDVLRVAHHGSRTSSTEEFLEAVHPAFRVISAGFENSYGHPRPAIGERLGEHHATILRTERDGLITIGTDGRRMSAETYR